MEQLKKVSTVPVSSANKHSSGWFDGIILVVTNAEIGLEHC